MREEVYNYKGELISYKVMNKAREAHRDVIV